jgi:signal transduction histidine kinase
MVNLPLQKVTGTKLESFIGENYSDQIHHLLTQGAENVFKKEVYLHAVTGTTLPVLLTANTFLLNNALVLSIILTDLTIQKKNEEDLKLKTTELEKKNKELIFQNEEKERCTMELLIANKELVFQSGEKEKRSAELILANIELLFQNEEKEKRAAELLIANKELEAFNYISSHDLQEPLRKIQTFSNRILTNEHTALSDTAKEDFKRIQGAAKRMQTFIEDLLTYSHTNISERIFENTDLYKIIEEVKRDLKETIQEKGAIIETGHFFEVNVIPFQFRQLMLNLISNALKFAAVNRPPHIKIKSSTKKGSALKTGHVNLPPTGLSPEKEYCHISITDNGIGFNPQYKEYIFGVFKRLHTKEEYPGTGIGLAIVKKIVENHNGFITATGELDKGARFDIYLPVH